MCLCVLLRLDDGIDETKFENRLRYVRICAVEILIFLHSYWSVELALSLEPAKVDQSPIECNANLNAQRDNFYDELGVKRTQLYLAPSCSIQLGHIPTYVRQYGDSGRGHHASFRIQG